MEIRRTSSARWAGGVEDGSGSVDIGRNGPQLSFSLKSRVGQEPASNPEELIGAALAGCYAMSFANELGEAGVRFDQVSAQATVHLVQGQDGFSIPSIDLVAAVAGTDIDVEDLSKIGQMAHEHCPVARLYDAEIRLKVVEA